MEIKLYAAAAVACVAHPATDNHQPSVKGERRSVIHRFFSHQNHQYTCHGVADRNGVGILIYFFFISLHSRKEKHRKDVK